MTFSVNPSTVAPSGSLTASGTGTKKRPYRITVAPEDPVMPGAILLEGKMPANGRFNALIHAPGGANRTTRLILRQPRPSDGVWAQTADVKLLVVAGGGGGTTPDPNPPPTPPPDVAPANIAVSGQTTTSAVISWTTTDASTGLVQYGTTTAYGSSTSSTSSGTSGNRSLTGLTPGQTYHFRVVTNSGTTTLMSGDRQFTTTAAPTLPGPPTGLVATGGNAQVVLTWTAPASNGGSAITGYRIFRNGVSLTTDPASPYTDSTVSNGTTYTFTVAAITAIGEGPQSASASATPAAAGDINPPVISNVVITVTGQTTATVTWNTNEAAIGVVEYGQSTSYGTQTSATSSGTTHSRSLTGLIPGTLYHIRIRATDTAGNLRLDSDRTFTTQTPGGSGTVTVGSISALLNALAVNQNTDITLTAGTYTGDIVIDSRFASRTNPCVIHTDGVTLQGCLRHRGGAHHLDWQGGITFANITISSTGVMVFGGYAGEAGPHHITLRNPTVLASVHRANAGATTDHSVYFSYATGDWGDILIEDLDVTATDAMGIATAIHGDHGYSADAPNVTAKRVICRRTVFRGNGTAGAAVQEPLILWQPPYHDWLFDGATITNTNGPAIRFESISATNIVFKDITSTNSRQGGFVCTYVPGGPYSVGSPPPGVTFTGCSLA